MRKKSLRMTMTMEVRIDIASRTVFTLLVPESLDSRRGRIYDFEPDEAEHSTKPTTT